MIDVIGSHLLMFIVLKPPKPKRLDTNGAQPRRHAHQGGGRRHFRAPPLLPHERPRVGASFVSEGGDGLTYSLGWVVSFVSGDPCTRDAGDAAVHRKVRPQVGPASSSVCLFVGVCMSAARVRAVLVSSASLVVRLKGSRPP